MKKFIKKTGRMISENKLVFLQMSLVILPQAICGATAVGSPIETGMPWDSGVNTIMKALTGPLPQAGAAVSIATSALMWTFGQAQVSQTAIRATMGTGIALSAPTAVNALSGLSNVAGSGCIF